MNKLNFSNSDCLLTQPPQVDQYTYDAVGNRLSWPEHAQYTYDNSNHLTSSDGISYTYDNNGNTLTKTVGTVTTTYSWDFENRLTQATLPSGGGSFTSRYDPFGRRIQKTSSSGTTNYLYDGANIVEEVSATGSSLARYTQNLGIDEPLVMDRAGFMEFYHADGLGTVTALAHGNGEHAETHIYDPFGNDDSPSGTNPFRFTGREWDNETGLYYYRARYYDPTIGRFISEDPIRFTAGIDFYTYAGDNPVAYSDPTGLKTCCRGEEKALVNRADKARKILDQLRNLGYIQGVTGVGGSADCIINRYPNGQIAEIIYSPETINVDPQKSPCVYECLLEHENVHKRMCEQLGAKFTSLSQAQKEIPAYIQELGCYLKTLYENHLGPYAQ